jgi:hypothetical protein
VSGLCRIERIAAGTLRQVSGAKDRLPDGRRIGLDDELDAALARVVSALRTMPPGKLAARLPGPTPTRADAGRLLARTLAVAAQGIEEAAAPTMPSWHAVPLLPDLAVGDQVNVMLHDLRVALSRDSLGGATADGVWTPQGRAPVIDVLRDVETTTEEVRRLL